MREDVAYTLLSEEEIQEAVHRLGQQISVDFEGKDPLFVGILKGSFIFMADLMRYVDIKCEVDFMAVSSYRNSTSTSGEVRILKDLNQEIENRHIIVVEDILDSGVTLSYLTEYLSARKPASISVVTLLDKPERRKTNIKANYFCFNIPDAFVVGYGLDYAEKYRNLPYIGVLKPEVYENN